MISIPKKTQATQDGTVGKTLHMLDIVAHYGKPVRFNEILRLSPFPKASTYRFLQTLTNQQMLILDPDTQRYSAGKRLIRLAYHAWQQATLAPVAAPFLEALSAQTNQTVHLAQLDNGQVLYIEKRNAKHPITMFSGAGKIGPAYCTGVGKAMLAFVDEKKRVSLIAQQSYYRYTNNTITTATKLKNELAEIQQTGKAFDNEEHENGIICVAVPILSNNKKVIGALSITGSTELTTLATLDTHSQALQQTASAIGESATNWQFPGI